MRTRPHRTHALRTVRFRPNLEHLESRIVPTVFTPELHADYQAYLDSIGDPEGFTQEGFEAWATGQQVAQGPIWSDPTVVHDDPGILPPSGGAANDPALTWGEWEPVVAYVSPAVSEPSSGEEPFNAPSATWTPSEPEPIYVAPPPPPEAPGETSIGEASTGTGSGSSTPMEQGGAGEGQPGGTAPAGFSGTGSGATAGQGEQGTTGTAPSNGEGENEPTAGEQGGAGQNLGEGEGGDGDAPPASPGGETGAGEGDSGSGSSQGEPASLTVRLLAPEITNQAFPEIAARVEATFWLPSVVTFQIDLNRDGDFQDNGESYAVETDAFWSDIVFSDWSQALTDGVYKLRVHIVDASGNQASDTTTMYVDWSMGFIGSQPLAELAEFVSSPETALDTDALEAFITEKDYRSWLVIDQDYRILVNARATFPKYTNAFAGNLTQGLSFEVIQKVPEHGQVIGWLPILNLPYLEGTEHFTAITPIIQPRLRVGLVDTQGDAVMGTDNFRTVTGFDGTGIRVGVISDSVNRFNHPMRPGAGLNESQFSNDLPNSVTVLQDGPPGGSDEGRAMLEIIHDIAPGASLFFHTGGVSPQVMANGINALVSAGANIIVDDIGWANSPMFNDGLVAKAVDAAVAANVVYVSAAGNEADRAWSGVWTPLSANVGGTTAMHHNFGGGDVFQDFTLGPSQQIRIAFQWSNAFLEGGSSLANYQVPVNFDVIITNTSNAQVAIFNTNNLNTDEAFEFVTFTNPSATLTQTFRLSFRLVAGTPAPGTILRWVDFGSTANINAQAQGGPTIFGHAAAKGAIAVGAVFYQTPSTPESFTALGGNLQFLFDANGAPLSTPEIRQKPDFAAPDGGDTSFFGNDIPGDGNFFPNFFGTSAAAAHLAGLVALLQHANGPLTPAEVYQVLQQTAIDVGAPGYDFLSGHGRVFLPDTLVPPRTSDTFESNDSEDQATDLGVLSVGTFALNDLSIHDNRVADDDWFRFRVASPGQLTINMRIRGFRNADLDFRLFTVNAEGTMIELANGTTKQFGGTESATVTVDPSMELFLYVYGYNLSMSAYELRFILS